MLHYTLPKMTYQCRANVPLLPRMIPELCLTVPEDP